MYLLTLLLQPPSPHEPQFNFSNPDQRPVLATAAQNYGAIGSKTGTIGKPTSPDSSFDMGPHQSRRKRIYKQADTFYEHPDTSVYFKQRKDGRTLADGAVGRKKALMEPILKVTTAKSPNPVIFKDPHGNLIGVSLPIPPPIQILMALFSLGNPRQAGHALRVREVALVMTCTLSDTYSAIPHVSSQSLAFG
jgi:hypothetical protein